MFGAALKEVAKWGGKRAYKEILYALKCKSNVKKLEEKVRQLRNKRQTVEEPVQLARRQGDTIYDGVKEWLLKVEKFIEDEEEFIKNAKIQCFNGLCPDYIERNKVSKKAVNAAKDGDELLTGGDFHRFSYRPRPQKTESQYVKGYEAFDSREIKLAEVMKALNDSNLNIIGIHGMAGVGKSTLVRKVAWQALEGNSFDEVVIADVEKNPDVKMIQDKIAFELGMEFDTENVYDRSNRLRQRFKKEKRVLVIIDNIWAHLDMDAVGIPYRDMEKGEDGSKGMIDGQRKFKVLLTSRSQDVLEKDMHAQTTILVEPLLHDEAMALFKKIQGCDVESEFRATADAIVTKCGGLPIAIATIATNLKSKDLPIWEDASEKLRNCDPSGVQGMEEIVKLTYESLKDKEARSLFLLFGLYGASYYIYIDDLLSYGKGLGLFKNVSTLGQARNRVAKLIDDLKDSCLLLKDETIPADYCKMHDMVHAAAVSIAASELSDHKPMHNIQNAVHLTEVLEENTSTAISMPFRDIQKLPEKLGFPKLNLFSLFAEDPSLQIPGRFFEGMTELRVLDLEYVNLQSLPSSFACKNLMNLRTLILDECQLEDVAKIGELKTLEVLSLWKTEIVRLPIEIGELTQLKLLNLGNCTKLQVIVPNVLSKLTALEELYMHNSFVQWEDERGNNGRRTNASLAELRELSLLTTLNIHVRDAQLIPQSLLFENLKRFKILIGYVWKWSGKYEASKTLKIKLDDSFCFSHGVKNLLKKTEDLYLDKVSGVSNVVSELNGEGFPQLKHLHLQNGSQFLSIVDFEGGVPCKVFPILESFVLSNLLNLEKICHSQLTEESFSRLRIVKVQKCHKLKHLFSFSTAKNLSGLQEMEVIHCWNLKELFSGEGEVQVHNNETDSRRIEFNQLQSLTLQGLPQFTNLGFNMKTSHTAAMVRTRSQEINAVNDHKDYESLFSERIFLPMLKNLRLSTIKIKSMWLQHLAKPTFGQYLSNLTVERCNNLKFLFPSSVVDHLGQLQNLQIQNCESLEGIIDTRIAGVNEMIKVAFTKLLCLELKGLPNFTKFGTANLAKFPILNKLRIENCPNLETFLWAPIFADERCHNDMQPLFDEKTSFPSLEKLEIFYLDNLRKIWHINLPFDSFSKLREVKVGYCKQVLQIFPSNMLERLQSLDSLMVGNCDSLEQVFTGGETHSVIEFQLREMHLFHLPRLLNVWNIQPQGSLAFKKLVSVKVHCCDNLRSLFPPCIAKGLLQLKELELISSAVEEIVAKEEQVHPRFCFPQLTSLTLWNLPKLRCFYPGQHISKWLMLRKLVICQCVELKIFASKYLDFEENIWESQHEIAMQQPLFWVEKVALSNLEELKLESNTFMKTIQLGSKHSEYLRKLKVLELVCFNDSASISPSCCIRALPLLEELIFSEVSSEERFSSEGLGGELSLIESLQISDCHNLVTLVPSSVSFTKLTTLEVSSCQIDCLMTISTAKSLVQLTNLSLSDCGMLQEIISHTGDGGKDQIIFSKLKYLILRCLPKLTSFCSGNHPLEFSSLEHVSVERCPEMQRFSHRILRTPKLRRVKFAEGEQDWCWEGDLNTTIREMFRKRTPTSSPPYSLPKNLSVSFVLFCCLFFTSFLFFLWEYVM